MHSSFLTLLLAALSSPLLAIAGTCGTSKVVVPTTGSGKIKRGWFAGWLGAEAISHIDWSKYTHVAFSFATTTNVTSVLDLSGSGGPEVVKLFVQTAQNAGVKTALSYGGWTGSKHFSPAVTPENRTTFVNTVVSLANEYGFDGIDLDWEYPGKQGDCNDYTADDSANFLQFLQEVKQAASNLTLSAAVGAMTPYQSDMSGYAEVLDYVALMAYDFWGQFPGVAKVGPNAPLQDACDPTLTPVGSVASAVQAWKNANFPIQKMVLGVAAYGHNYTVTPSNAIDSSTGALALYPPFIRDTTLIGRADQCSDDALQPITTIDFDVMISQGFLNSNGIATPGNTYYYDNCSQTPYIYNSQTQTMVAYDDATSFAAKGAYIKQNNLAGFSVWDLSGDSNDILYNAISGAMND